MCGIFAPVPRERPPLAPPRPRQRLPRAAAPPTRPARRGSPVDASRRQAERGAAPSGQAAQDGREEGQQGICIKLSIDSFRKHDGFVVLTYTLLQYLRCGPSFSRGLGRQTFGGGTDVCEKAA